MRVLQVVPGIREEASGPSYTIPRLCSSLAKSGVGVELHVLEPLPDTRDQAIETHAYPVALGLGRFGHSPAMRHGLDRALKQADLIHNHSLWMMPNIYPGALARKHGKPLLFSPRGTLSAWALAHSKWRKRLVWWLGQQGALKQAVCLHATAESEWADIRRIGLQAPVAIIPNGIEVGPPKDGSLARSVGMRRLLYLGRLHPIKALDTLLAAWAELAPHHPDWELWLVGPDDGGFGARLRRMVDGDSIPRVYLPGPAYGEEKWRYYRESELFVLSSHSENFAMSVAEALAQGTPALVSHGAPWEGLTREGAGWWISNEQRVWKDALDRALKSTPDELLEAGERGRQWMLRDFSWHHIGEMMRETYAWVLGGGTAPPWVRRS